MPYYHIQLPEFRKKYKSFESVKGEPFLTWLYLLDEAYKNEEKMKMLTLSFSTEYDVFRRRPSWTYRS